MLNKKILAVAVASAFTMSAQAAITLTDTTADLVTYATETFTSTDLNADGLLPVDGTALDVVTNLGFTVAAGTSKYVRIDLSAGEFAAVPALAGVNVDAGVSSGGDGESFVIFEITGDNGGTPVELPAATVVTLSAADYAISTTATNTVTYALYESAANAVNQTAGTALSTRSEAMTSTASASTGTFTVPGEVTATVGSKFLKFVDPADSSKTVTEIAVGAVDASKLLKTGTFLTPAGAAVVVGDLYTTPQDITFAGDFSFGTWTTDSAADCSNAGTAVTLNSTKTAATAANVALGAVSYLCVDNGTKKQTMNKGSYSATLSAKPKLTNTVGKIVYNTTTVEVPYVTTFSAYNQRVYIVNNGVVPATYSMTFTSENGVVATALGASSGSVPAGEMVALKVTDLVDIAGKTRTSAIIEIEAEDEDVMVSSQTVNLSTGGTDTVVHN
ncbi:hypothetical protein [Bowmanella yangjiangensis]|uniref:Uncharacterized protein n=1 Tax=Bowmanella yangjiangensis TaxID=2811230 RepID=A0ABS3CTJ2_9ALTE|nr:hypothetical protein [Bowmanella yangjiangensis]MBN7820442.1 hypothetical protein [Bowmanella yangjiangensis]